jgi:topoisomerase-4 subunit A
MDDQPNLFDSTPADDDTSLTLARYAERAYLDYAVSVVKGRALPDVADGQKPVQRRILYAMNEMGLGPTSKPVKSARVVGDVLGRFHPHGDTAAYDALVRMAQAFTLRYPLIDGQGNFGSRDGDGAAAMRYTEARLTPYARLLLDEIDQGTVDFVANYDGSTEEPALLPARLPMVLLNGASGIAVGMATEIPPHNLREVALAAVALLKSGRPGGERSTDAGASVQADLDLILALLPGPDFPGGGQVISSPADLREVYGTGRGSIKVRARHVIEDLARGQWQLVVTELPHGVSAAKVLEEIEELTNPKVRVGKKALTPEQLQLKQQLLGVLDTVRDESGRDAPVRLVFEPRTSKVGQQELLSTLLAHTSLEAGVPVNLVMIGRDGRPQQKNLPQILREWLVFRLETVTRRTRHRLGKVDDRIHILEGRQLVLLNIDEVIRIIRESDEPKAALIAAFALSDRQAEDILEIRLRQLARLEALRIEQELKALREERGQLQALLDSETAMRRLVAREIEADAKQYGDARRTLIEEAARTVAELRIAEEPVTVIVSEKGWVRARQGHGHDPSQFSFKAGDAFYGAFEVMTTDQLFAIGSTGRAHSVPVASLPSARGDGVPVTSFVELEPGTRIEHVFAAHAETGVLVVTRGGNGFQCRAGDLVGRNKAGRQFVTLDEGDAPARPALFAAGLSTVACLAGMPDRARMLVFDLADVKVLRNGGRGTALVDLDPKESLLQAIVCGDSGVVLSGLGNRARPMEDTLTLRALGEYRGSRGRKGKLLEPRRKDPRLALPRPAGARQSG